MSLFDKTINTLSKSLDLHLVRHSVISDNIANAETPGYKARKVDFEAALQNALENEERGIAGTAIEDVQPSLSQDPISEMGQDLNTVDMDREMATLSKNDIQYSAATQLVTKKFGLLKYAIGAE